MKARIYQPSRTATQSGVGRTRGWILEYETESDHAPDPLMGWATAQDTMDQIKLRFDSLDEAKAFADEKNMEYTVLPMRERRIKPRNFSDNFKYRAPESEE